MNLRQLQILLILGGFAILLHQFINYGTWFEPEDFFHHEVFAGLLFVGAIGLFLVRKVKGGGWIE